MLMISPPQKILAANQFMWVQRELAAKDCSFLYIQKEIFNSNLWSERTLRLCRYAEILMTFYLVISTQ